MRSEESKGKVSKAQRTGGHVLGRVMSSISSTAGSHCVLAQPAAPWRFSSLKSLPGFLRDASFGARSTERTPSAGIGSEHPGSCHQRRFPRGR